MCLANCYSVFLRLFWANFRTQKTLKQSSVHLQALMFPCWYAKLFLSRESALGFSRFKWPTWTSANSYTIKPISTPHVQNLHLAATNRKGATGGCTTAPGRAVAVAVGSPRFPGATLQGARRRLFGFPFWTCVVFRAFWDTKFGSYCSNERFKITSSVWLLAAGCKPQHVGV